MHLTHGRAMITVIMVITMVIMKKMFRQVSTLWSLVYTQIVVNFLFSWFLIENMFPTTTEGNGTNNESKEEDGVGDGEDDGEEEEEEDNEEEDEDED